MQQALARHISLLAAVWPRREQPDSSYPFAFATVNARIWCTTAVLAEAIEAERGIALVEAAIAEERAKALARVELLLVLGDDDG